MLQVGSPPLADFDRPVDMMEDCHRRVERFLDALVRVARDAPPQLDADWCSLLAGALDYFDGAAPLHTADEEESLFPRVREHAANPAAAEAIAALERLHAEHERAHPLHDLVERVGRRWLADGTIDTDARAAFTDATTQLQQLYVDHIRLEEEVVFVAARLVLSRDELGNVGTEMRTRRGGSCRDRRPPAAAEDPRER